MPAGNGNQRDKDGNTGWFVSGGIHLPPNIIAAEAVNECQVKTKQSDVLESFIELQEESLKEFGIEFDTK